MNPRMTVVIPILIQDYQPDLLPVKKQLVMTLRSIGCLRRNATEPFDLLIIDHGSVKAAETMLKNLCIPNLTYVRHEERDRGMVDAINEAWKTTDTPFLAFMHNDFFILGEDWDGQAMGIGNGDPKLGIVGFGGGYGMGKDGMRYGFASNMVDANIHGVHRWKGCMPAVVLDGMMLIMTRKMLDAVKGIPTEYKIHFFYDQHMCAASVFAGFHNYVLFVRCQHLSGQTLMAENVKGREIYNHNQAVFTKLWSSRLPVYVTARHKVKRGFASPFTHDAHFFPDPPQGLRRVRAHFS